MRDGNIHFDALINGKVKNMKKGRVHKYFRCLIANPLVLCSFLVVARPKKPCEIEPTEERPIVIVIPSYNNNKKLKDGTPYYEKNLDSVCYQNYSNYHVIYIDDVSPDGTGDLVEAYIKDRQLEDRVTLIKNEKRIGALANLYYAIHGCDDNVIIVLVDGDDWLAHNDVLYKLNKVYTNYDVWLTYGNFRQYPKNRRGFCHEFPAAIRKNNGFRKAKWVISHLRTFYSWLFKRIKLEDLLYEGEFYSMAWDLAIMYPMIEMAGTHYKCISDCLYIYNMSNPISDGKKNRKLQLELAYQIKGKEQYDRLDTIPAGVSS